LELYGPTTKVEGGIDENKRSLEEIKNLRLGSTGKAVPALTEFIDKRGFEEKYPLGFALFYSDGRKTLYYGRSSSSGISFDPSILKVRRLSKDQICIDVHFDVLGTSRDVGFSNSCFHTTGPIIKWFKADDIDVSVEPLARSADGAAWIIGISSAAK